MQEIQGYKVIRLHVKKGKGHTIFAKENSTRVKDPKKPSGKTLFLLNIPPYVTEDSLKKAFSPIGEVSSVLFSSKASKNDDTTEYEIQDKFISKKPLFRFKVAYVVFKTTKSIQKALELKSIRLYDEKGKTFIKSGIDKWMQEYIDSIPNEKSLQAEIDDYMAKYDKKEQEEIEAEKSVNADNDGWITVTKKGRNRGFEQKESVINKLEEKRIHNRKNKELKNFYTFQIRESKMQNIVSLRKKFDEDKKRIETLKKTRRFKPF